MFTTHNAAVTAISVDAVMLSRRLIASLPSAQFTHQSSNLTACPMSRTASWLVLQLCILAASDSHQSRMQSLQWLCLYSGCSSLSPADADTESNPGWQRKTAATTFAVICGWSVAGAMFYDIIITAQRHQSVCRLLVADIPQLDQLIWRTSRHLTRRLHTVNVGALGERMLIIYVSELLEIAVRIIEYEKIIPFWPKHHVWIIREVELLEQKVKR